MKTTNSLVFFGLSSIFILNSLVSAKFASDNNSFTNSRQFYEDNGSKHSTDLPLENPRQGEPLHLSIVMLPTLHRHRRQGSTSDNNLLEFRRRSWRIPFFIRRYTQRTDPSSVNRRRSQPLSVTGPLSSLANMLVAEGRRRLQSESVNNRMRLLELGKRSPVVLNTAETLRSASGGSSFGLNLTRLDRLRNDKVDTFRM